MHNINTHQVWKCWNSLVTWRQPMACRRRSCVPRLVLAMPSLCARPPRCVQCQSVVLSWCIHCVLSLYSHCTLIVLPLYSHCTLIVLSSSPLQVSRDVFEAAQGRLKVVGRAGVGVDNVDLAAATEVCGGCMCFYCVVHVFLLCFYCAWC